MARRVEISLESLKEMYEVKKLTTYQIADKLGCCQATIWKKLIEFRITRRKPQELNSFVPSKEILKELYENQKLSTWEIEKRFNYSRGTVFRKLIEHGIHIRDRADSHIKNKRKDFSKNLLEKAYLIGFRLGDLGVRRVYPNSKTICVATGSTIPAQIDLITALFEDYGKIWVKKTKDNKINFQTNLNESFNFLLSKEFPSWVVLDKSLFFSFLAGFSDAEGHFGIGNKQAYFSLGNYDDELLLKIYKNLNRFGIVCNLPKHDFRKGKKNSQGYMYNSNYYTLRVGTKIHLLNLLNELKPYIKHAHKIKDLNMAIANIESRNQFRSKK